MPGQADSQLREVFISYASQDRERTLRVADVLERAGVRVWLDRKEIRRNYGEEIVRAIRACKVLMLMCSDASLRSRNVKAEIQLAWKYAKPYLPVLLEPVSFPEQVEYWLEGWQWVEVFDAAPREWLPSVLAALAYAGVAVPGTDRVTDASSVGPRPILAGASLRGLRSVAKLTDQIWPVAADRLRQAEARPAIRGLGAPQDGLEHGHRLGSRVCLAIESDRTGYLLLLDEGPEGIVYCLCPSCFAPDSRLRAGRSYLPQAGSRCDSFVLTGKPGREHLLAIITDKPLGLDWTSTDPAAPARVLTPGDLDELLRRLRELEGDRWVALSTYFDVLP